MNTENNNPSTLQDGQNNSSKETGDQKPLNPFDKTQQVSTDNKESEEEAAAEQQRKEALTERD